MSSLPPDFTGPEGFKPPGSFDPESSSQPRSSKLGSLAQSARGKQLKTARWILLIIGVLTVVANGFVVANAPSMVKAELKKEIDKAHKQGLVIDQNELKKVEERAIRITRLVASVLLGLGVLYILFGFAVTKYPVPITITSLILYIGTTAVIGLLNPSAFDKVNWVAIFIKILIIVCLAKAVQAALAYEKERSRDNQSSLPPGSMGTGDLE